jgi:hypothetical protein
MKFVKTVALTGTFAVAAMLGTAAFAADTAPAANAAHAKCEQEAKDKKLTGDAAKALREEVRGRRCRQEVRVCDRRSPSANPVPRYPEAGGLSSQ